MNFVYENIDVEKEKTLISSNLCIFYSIFNSVLLHGRKCSKYFVSSLPHDKILDDQIESICRRQNVEMIALSDKVENIVGKGENAGFQQFLLFSQRFHKSSFGGSLKVRILK